MADKKTKEQTISKEREVTPMPEWMGRQLDLVDKKIATWSPAKQKWAGTNVTTDSCTSWCNPGTTQYFPDKSGMDMRDCTFSDLSVKTTQPVFIYIEFSYNQEDWIARQLYHSSIELDDSTGRLTIQYNESFSSAYYRYFRLRAESNIKTIISVSSRRKG